MSKRLLLFLFALPIMCYAQQKTYNTTIGKSDRVEIKNGIVTIKKADTVIIKIYSQKDLKTNLILSSYGEFRDSLGVYTIRLLINNPEEFEYNNVNIKLKFNKPILNVQAETGLAFAMTVETSADKLSWGLAFKKCECEDGIKLTITSKEKVVCSIFGISEKL